MPRKLSENQRQEINYAFLYFNYNYFIIHYRSSRKGHSDQGLGLSTGRVFPGRFPG